MINIAKSLNYLDFAQDEFMYLIMAYNRGLRFNAMIGQAQRVCAGWLKQIIVDSLMTNTEVMMSSNIRRIYDYIMELGIDLRNIRKDIMTLSNYSTSTRYPGKDAFMATDEDIDAVVDALCNIDRFIVERGLRGEKMFNLQ